MSIAQGYRLIKEGSTNFRFSELMEEFGTNKLSQMIIWGRQYQAFPSDLVYAGDAFHWDFFKGCNFYDAWITYDREILDREVTASDSTDTDDEKCVTFTFNSNSANGSEYSPEELTIAKMKKDDVDGKYKVGDYAIYLLLQDNLADLSFQDYVIKPDNTQYLRLVFKDDDDITKSMSLTFHRDPSESYSVRIVLEAYIRKDALPDYTFKKYAEYIEKYLSKERTMKMFTLLYNRTTRELENN